MTLAVASGTNPETAPTNWVEIDWCGRDVRIEYQWLRREDDGAPLMVFLHEGLGSVSMWRDFPRLLCDALRCQGLVYSRPGYGQSTPRHEDETWGPDFMHRQAHQVLPALLKALNIETAKAKLWLFGHSDGGSIALLYAAKFPENVSGAVVLAPHIFVEDISISSIAQARTAYAQTDLRERLSRHHDNVDSAFRGWNDVWLHPEFRQWNIQTELSTITCPVIAIQGVDDEYGTLEQIYGIAKVVQHCSILKFSDCGHSPHRDQQDRLIEAVRYFIQQHHETYS